VLPCQEDDGGRERWKMRKFGRHELRTMADTHPGHRQFVLGDGGGWCGRKRRLCSCRGSFEEFSALRIILPLNLRIVREGCMFGRPVNELEAGLVKRRSVLLPAEVLHDDLFHLLPNILVVQSILESAFMFVYARTPAGGDIANVSLARVVEGIDEETMFVASRIEMLDQRCPWSQRICEMINLADTDTQIAAESSNNGARLIGK